MAASSRQQAAPDERAGRSGSPWSPLRHPVFRWLWIATVASNVGTWLQGVGAAWLMTSLTPSTAMVALVQAATSLPMFLLSLPAGALADVARPPAPAADHARPGCWRRPPASACSPSPASPPLAAARLHLPARPRRGAERAGVAGDHPRAGAARGAAGRRRAGQRRLQSRPRRRSGARRPAGGRRRARRHLPAQRRLLPRRHRRPLPLAARRSEPAVLPASASSAPCARGCATSATRRRCGR